MKALKIAGLVVASLLALVLLALLTIPLWIGPVGRSAINKAVPELTGTGFNLESFALNPYSGHVRMEGIALENPVEEAEGEPGLVSKALGAVSDFVSTPETNAVTIGSIDVKLETTSLLSDTVKIHEVEIKDVYVYGDVTLSNWRTIWANIQKNLGDEKKEDESAGKKVIVEKLTIVGAKVRYGAISVPLPEITIRDIGKEDEPVTEETFLQRLADEFWSVVEKTVGGLKSAGSATTDALKGGAEKAMDLVDGLNPFSKKK